MLTGIFLSPTHFVGILLTQRTICHVRIFAIFAGKCFSEVMKSGRIFSAIIALFVLAVANGAPVSYEQAKAIAMRQLSATNPTKVLSEQIPGNETDTPPYYIFTGNSGEFVIVAGDNRAYPILGYGKNWDNENIPDALSEILTAYSEQIKQASEDAPVMALPTSETIEKVLTTAKWGQDEPYNNLTPDDYPAGCVATAMATVMKYHNHPETGTGFNSYEWSGQMLSCDFSSITFDWDNMRMSYNSTDGYSDTEAHAVAQLLQACGVAVEMYYASSGSASTILDAATALVDYFKYDGTCQYVSSSDFSEDGWKELIRSEIDANRPVIYSGKSSSGSGHAFVCDGYNSDGLFHFNWGWSGACDGFYALDAMKPLFTDYSLRAAMVTNIKPAENDVTYSHLITANTGMGLSIDTENIETGVPFNAFVGGISSTGDIGEWNGQLAIALTDNIGTIKEIIRAIDIKFSSLLELSTEFIGCTATCEEISDSDMISLVARSGTVGKWLPVRGTIVRPASCKARGNTVRRATVTWDIHPESMAITIDPECGNSSLEHPILSSSFSWTATIPENTASLYYAIDGTEVTADNGSYSIASVNRDYTITIHAYSNNELIGNHTVNVPTAGTLPEFIATHDAGRISSLTVTGTIDVRDFDFMRERMTALAAIDLSNAKITSRLSNHALHIPYNAFDGCRRLKSITLPNTLVGIHDYAFRRTSLTTIDLPASTKKIGDGAFYSAESLTYVTARNPEPATITSRVFFGTKRNSGTLYVPTGSYSKYKSASFWSLFGQIIEDPSLSGTDKMIADICHPTIMRNGNVLTISETGENAEIEIFSMNGNRIYNSIINHNHSIELPDKGFFIVSINGKFVGKF